jgi:hypothetical protein
LNNNYYVFIAPTERANYYQVNPPPETWKPHTGQERINSPLYSILPIEQEGHLSPGTGLNDAVQKGTIWRPVEFSGSSL